MRRRIVVRDRARYDAIDLAYEICEDNVDASIRFADAIDEAFSQLADFPGMGVLREYDNPKLAGMRMWQVPRFRNYLIFYQANDVEITVLRVLYGARDLESLFAPDEDE